MPECYSASFHSQATKCISLIATGPWDRACGWGGQRDPTEGGRGGKTLRCSHVGQGLRCLRVLTLPTPSSIELNRSARKRLSVSGVKNCLRTIWEGKMRRNLNEPGFIRTEKFNHLHIEGVYPSRARITSFHNSIIDPK